MNLYERQPDETIIDYIDRLVENKKEYDLDHAEVYDLVSGITLSSCESRKRLYGWADLIELLKKEGFENLTEDEIFKKLEKKKLELYKERTKLSTIRNDLNRQYRDEARRELILEEIRNLIPTVEKVKFQELKTSMLNKSYVLTISDIHYASFFKSINNEYSMDIVKNRFEKLLSETIAFIEKENVSKLYIANLGDSIQGLLRISDLKKSQIGLLESVVSFSRFIGDWLNQLSQFVEIEYYHVPTANHSDIRLFDEKKNQVGENLEYVIINYIYDYLKDNLRIHVMLPQDDADFLEVNIEGFEMILLHGHQVKNINTILEKLSMRNQRFYDYVLMGHFHSGVEKPVYEGKFGNREILISPSIVGSDPYSDTIMVGSKSAAKIYTFEKYKGKIQSNTIILN